MFPLPVYYFPYALSLHAICKTAHEFVEKCLKQTIIEKTNDLPENKAVMKKEKEGNEKIRNIPKNEKALTSTEPLLDMKTFSQSNTVPFGQGGRLSAAAAANDSSS